VTQAASKVVLLGSIPETWAHELPREGRIATIRAGFQEWEGDDERLSQALEGRDVNLSLHARADRIWQEDPALRDGHRAMQERVRLLRSVYNVRLSRLADAWIELLRTDGPGPVLDPEREAALDAIRALDERQRERVAELRSDFEARFRPGERPAVLRERAEVEALLSDSRAIVVDGGHVAVLLNRLRLFGIERLVGGRIVFGIAGGAMVLAERLVLVHDTPPWGPGHAEVAEGGLGLFPGVVALPQATTRLRLDDQDRVWRLSRRFAPARCVLLDPGGRAEWNGHRWEASGLRCVSAEGRVERWDAAA
jgi:hypothetical protein